MFAGTEDGTDGDKPPKPTTALFLYIDAKANEEKKKCPQVKTLHGITTMLPDNNVAFIVIFLFVALLSCV
jgi:hypothetical protein